MPVYHDAAALAGAEARLRRYPPLVFAGEARKLQGALAKLSPELRETIILRDLQELEYREIADILGIPEGTVKSRLNRGRAELGRLLKKYRTAV